MRCSPSVDARRGTGLTHRLAATVLMSLIAWWLHADTGPGSEPGFEVVSAGTRLVDGVHRLRAHVDFRFSDEAVEAMENGVAVTVSVEMQVLEIGRLVDRKVAAVTARYRIQVHALSRQYLVKNLSTGETATYRSFDDMREGLGTIDGFPLLDDHLLDDDESYRARVRAILEIESLPTPLRLLAYLKSAWRLSSDWLTWPLQR